ncbi:MAG: FMN-binding protein [Christensenellaceae bacterium]|nr:FMN-binding protein [Christensenellaceae bacterium]
MKKKRKIVLWVILLVVAGGFFTVKGILAHVEANLAALKSVAIAQTDLAALKDGTYFGSYSVFPVSAEVNVTVKDHMITGIELVKHTHGQGAPAEVIPGKVVEAQSLRVDSVSGATYSSMVILKAIENALLAAGQ